ncbi:MAG: outer membrane protein insertion porin family [Verrucomicrobiales bacterium]|jgi:outer membrane protein insertion porin family
MKKFANTWFAAAFTTLALFATGGLTNAQDVGSPKTVRGIEIEYIGPVTIDAERIRANMALKVGDELSQGAVDDDLKSLYTNVTGIENIRILTEDAGANGVTVIVVVQTYQKLGGYSFRGNTVYTSDRLDRAVTLTIGQPVNDDQVRAGQQEIRKLYREGGYSEIGVNYDIVPGNQEGFVNVVYKINEGGKSLLRQIDFVGNAAFKDRELREQMSSKEISLLSPILHSGRIDSDQLADDLDALEKHYKDAGYLNARIADVKRVRVDDKRVDIVITIEEGDIYSIEGVKIAGASAFSVGDLSPVLKSGPGQTFSAQNIEDDIQALRDYYGSRGYAEARVTPQLDSAGGTGVSVTYDIFEGGKYHIRGINISGNNVTQDVVIRRELAIEPGDQYNTPRIQASKRRLENTAYYSNVDVLPVDTDAAGYKDINIHVAERPTGTLNFGAGFSSIDNFVGFVEVTQTNFDITNWKTWRGAGQRFRAAARIGTERKDLTASWTEPWLFGKPLAFTTELFYRDLLFLSDVYEQTQYGVKISFRKKVGEFSNLQLNQQFQNVEIGGIDPRASDIIKAEEGEFLHSSLGLDYIHDTRDDIFIPRSGHRFNAGASYSGLGGDIQNTHFEAGAVQYFHLPFDSIFSIEGHFHAVEGEDTPIFERRFLGGANNLRGFDFRDVGPKDATGEAIGGLTSAYATAEYTFPIIRQIRGALFYDIGVVSEEELSLDGDVNANYGVGIRLYLPVGPLRLDYGIPTASDEFNDNNGRFNFNIGYRF